MNFLKFIWKTLEGERGGGGGSEGDLLCILNTVLERKVEEGGCWPSSKDFF